MERGDTDRYSDAALLKTRKNVADAAGKILYSVYIIYEDSRAASCVPTVNKKNIYIIIINLVLPEKSLFALGV